MAQTNVQITAGSGTKIDAFQTVGGDLRQAIVIADPSTDANTATVTAANALKVDNSGVTQPISGTITANAGTGPATAWKVDLSSTGANTTAIKVDPSGVTSPVSGTVTANAGTGTFNVADANLELSQASTTAGQKGPIIQGAVTTAAPTYTTAQTDPLSLDTSGNLRVSLKDTPANTNNLNVNLAASAATVTVSGTVTANAGTGTFNSSDANAQAQGSTTSGQKGFLEMGAVTTAAPSYTTAQTSPLSLNTSGGLRVDGSGVTQPVSGTVTANAGTGTFNTSAAQSGTWTVQPGNTANTTAWLTSQTPATSGGLTIYRLLSAATTNGNNIKASAGQLYAWYISNTGSGPAFVKLYNKATAPTVGTDTPVITMLIPANSTAANGTAANAGTDSGIAFSTGIGIGITGAVTDADTTAVVANQVVVNLFYK